MLCPKPSQLRHGLSLPRTFLGLNLFRRSVTYDRSAAKTRGMPARSLVTLTPVQAGASSRGFTAGRLLWPGSRAGKPPGGGKFFDLGVGWGERWEPGPPPVTDMK